MKQTATFMGIFFLLVMKVFAADPPEPVLYYSFDEDFDDEIEDLSGNENTGTVFGGGKPAEGKFGGGIELAGPDTVDVEHSDSLNFTDELTVGVWVNLVGTANQKIIGKAPIGSGWVLGVNGGIYPECWDKNGTNHTTTTGTVPAGTWTHLALTYSSETSDMILYIDGEQVGKLNNGGNPIGATNNRLIIGASPWGKDWPSAGIYDEIKLYNVAFDADQVKILLMEEGIGRRAAVSPVGNAATTWGDVKNQ